jgi:hypothetical protein
MRPRKPPSSNQCSKLAMGCSSGWGDHALPVAQASCLWVYTGPMIRDGETRIRVRFFIRPLATRAWRSLESCSKRPLLIPHSASENH